MDPCGVLERVLGALEIRVFIWVCRGWEGGGRREGIRLRTCLSTTSPEVKDTNINEKQCEIFSLAGLTNTVATKS